MKRWVYLISILALVVIIAVVAAAAAPVEAQEQEVTSIKPGGTYHIYFTVKKPAGMALTGNWEVRVYFYNGLNCFNTAPSGNDDGWWQPEGSTAYLYTGYWDHRASTRNVSWSSPDEKEWAQYVPIIHYPAENGNHERRYPPTVGESYENIMSEIPVGQTVSIRARLLLRNLANVTFDEANSIVTFKYGGKTYSYAYTLSTYGDVRLDDIGATLAQSEGTLEWSLRFDQNSSVLVDENAPATGRITIPGTIDFSMMTPSGGTGIPLWMIIVAIVVVLVVIVVAVLVVKMRGAGGVSP